MNSGSRSATRAAAGAAGCPCAASRASSSSVSAPAASETTAAIEHASRPRTRGVEPIAAMTAPETSSEMSGRTRSPCMHRARAEHVEHGLVDVRPSGRILRHLCSAAARQRSSSLRTTCTTLRWSRRPAASRPAGRRPAARRTAGLRRAAPGPGRGRAHGRGRARARRLALRVDDAGDVCSSQAGEILAPARRPQRRVHVAARATAPRCRGRRGRSAAAASIPRTPAQRRSVSESAGRRRERRARPGVARARYGDRAASALLVGVPWAQQRRGRRVNRWPVSRSSSSSAPASGPGWPGCPARPRRSTVRFPPASVTVTPIPTAVAASKSTSHSDPGGTASAPAASAGSSSPVERTGDTCRSRGTGRPTAATPARPARRPPRTGRAAPARRRPRRPGSAVSGKSGGVAGAPLGEVLGGCTRGRPTPRGRADGVDEPGEGGLGTGLAQTAVQ